MPTSAPANTIGLTATAYWDGAFSAVQPIVDQLEKAGVPTRTRDLPGIVGMGGCAQLICYTSPKRGREVTVLVIPHQSDVDQFGETYYYFDLTEDEACAGDVDARWAGLYDQCREIAP
jgi:hypothetical protein